MRFSLLRCQAAWAFAVAIALVSRAGVAPAEEKSAADLLPSTTVIYGEITDPNQLLKIVLEHPLRERIEQLDEVQKAVRGDKYQQFQTALALIELQTGMKWKPALEALTNGGVFVAVDAKTQGVAVLLKARDEQALEKITQALLKLAREDAKRNDRPDPIPSRDYRGLTAYKAGDGVVAPVGPWLVASNKGDLVKEIADRYLGDDRPTLSSTPGYQQAKTFVDGKPAAWAYVDVAILRDAGFAKQLFRDKSDNPVAELLLGGVLDTLQKAPFLVAQLDIDADHVKLAASLPHVAAQTSPAREYFFGADGKGAAPESVRPQSTLLSLSTYRGLSGWWLAKEDLFEEPIVARMAQVDSQFSTLFSGLDFGQDVLGAAKPEMQLVLARQNFAELKTPQPDIQLPAGAVLVQLKEPEKMQRRLKVAFQSFVGFLNINLAQQGQPQLDLETISRGDARITSATYLPDETKPGLINYNFSPTLAFVGNQMIVSSTRPLAEELVDLIAGADDDRNQEARGPDSESRATVNTRGTLDLQVLGELLNDNRQHLVAKNMLEKGHDKDAAEKEIGTLLSLLGAGRDLSLRLATEAEKLTLDVELRFAADEK